MHRDVASTICRTVVSGAHNMAESFVAASCGHCRALRDLREACRSDTGTFDEATNNINWQCDHCRALQQLYRNSPWPAMKEPADIMSLDERLQALGAEVLRKTALIARLENVIRVLLGPRYSEVQHRRLA